MKTKPILFLLSILFSSHVSAWTITADFETGNIGDKAESPNPDAFHDVAGNSKYVRSPVLSGNQAASLTAIKGQTGFGKWGGGFNYPALGEGEQIWFRINVLYPTGWTFSCDPCSQGMKFMRIHTRSAGGDNEGYHSTLIKGGSTGGRMSADSEVNGGDFWEGNNGYNGLLGLGSPVVRDKWIAYEMQIKFSSVPGRGIYRIWQDGKLIFEDLETATLRSSSSKSNLIYLYTYWNNGTPQTQTSYADDIVITNETPGRTDSFGNPYIGVGPSIVVVRPKTPSVSIEG